MSRQYHRILMYADAKTISCPFRKHVFVINHNLLNVQQDFNLKLQQHTVRKLKS